jgi:phosphatidylglycerol:prolipoprotein diacylglycerol transferase
LIYWFLWAIRKKTTQTGKLFMIYLMLAGIERFVIEFLRPNPRIIFDLSEAQLISLVLIALGLFGWRRFTTSAHTLKAK